MNKHFIKNNIRFFSLMLAIFIPSSFLYAEPTTYTGYNELIEKNCENPELKWNSWAIWNINIPAPKYSELTKSALTETKANLKANANDAENRAWIEWELTRTNTVFSALGLAQTQYRNAMNQVFSCAILSSREKMLVNLTENLKSKTTNKESEITRKLEKEIKRIGRTKSTIKCQPSGNATDSKMYEKLINSSTLQYCHYRNYIEYLESNIWENIDDIRKLESRSNVSESTTMISVANSIQAKQRSLSGAINKAERSIDRAIESYKEMERTYSVHILLVILYDDYVRLRDNLWSYFDIVSQTFEKANNAQAK